MEVYKFLEYYIIVNNLNPLTFLYEDVRLSNKRYVWISHESYGKRILQVIKEILLKNQIYDPCFINLPIFVYDYSFLKCITSDILSFSEVKDFNNIYKESDLELLRFYLTLYPERLIPNI